MEGKGRRRARGTLDSELDFQVAMTTAQRNLATCACGDWLTSVVSIFRGENAGFEVTCTLCSNELPHPKPTSSH